MKFFGGDRHRHPQHARPSVLAPTRAVVVVGGFGLLAAAVVAGCAAVTGHQAGAAAPARPSAVHHPALADPAVAALAPAPATAQRLGAGDFGAPGTGPTGTPVFAAILKSADAPPDAAPVSGLASSGIPSTALSAYEAAATREAGLKPTCGISWPLLAGIGRVESNHGRFAGAILHADGISTPRIIGIPLNGHGTALIRDTDGGRLDGDTVYDRAVGPMQFIPSTWASWGVDADHDGVKNPFDVFDAAAAAADYLCAAGRDLTTTHGQVQAILSYNYSYDYVSMVMGLERVYAQQVGVTVPILPTAPATEHGRPHHKPPLPPVDPGRPGGLKTPTPPKHTPTPPPTSTSASKSPSTSGSTRPSTPSDSPTTTPDCPTDAPSTTSSSTASSGASSSSAPPPGCPTPTGTSSSAASEPPPTPAALTDPGSGSSSP